MIKIYTIPNCDHCQEAKDFCKENSIEYEEINLGEKNNRSARAYYRNLGIKTAPVIVGNDKNGKEIILTEFDEDLMKMMV